MSPPTLMWAGVDRLLDRAPNAGVVRAHQLGPLAAKRWRQTGRSVPTVLVNEERLAALAAVIAPALIRRIREAYDGPLIVFKGPEIAARYPSGGRLFSDVDMLVPDASAAQRALLAAGFVEVEDEEGIFVDLHHLPPVAFPSIPMAVEIHSRPKWPYDLDAPPMEAIFESAVESSCAIAGVLAPAPAQHAVMLAAHGWGHEPLRRLRDLVDVAAASAGVDRAELAQLAHEWGIDGVWKTMHEAAECLFYAGRTTVPLRTWSRHLSAVRERTVFENHIERWLSGIWGLPGHQGVGYAFRRMIDDVRPGFDETWSEKATRTAWALRHAFATRSKHDEQLGDAAFRGQRRNLPSYESDA
jgi:Uncharacterised nucleotidyltransferase